MTNETMTPARHSRFAPTCSSVSAAPRPPARGREGSGGRKPAEQPDVLLAEFEQAAERLRTLIARINRTNLAIETAEGETLTAALARRDVLAFVTRSTASSRLQPRSSRSATRCVRSR